MVALVSRRRRRLFFQILLRENVVTGLDSFTRRFHLFRIEHERRPVADHVDDETFRRFRECFRQIIQRANFLAVDFIDDAVTDRAQDKY